MSLTVNGTAAYQIMKSAEISFVIPHKGRERLLVPTLKSVLMQQFPLDKVEIILVTQNETLNSSINALKNNCSLHIYHRPSSETVSQLRNYGAGKAHGKYLAFIDADIELSSNWITEMLFALEENSERVLISAGQINSDNANYLEKVRSSLGRININSNVNALGGGNLFTTKEIFVKAGKFPEHLTTCEDYYFTDKVNKLGDLYYTSKASFIHLGEDKDNTEMFKKEIWRSQSNLLSIKGRKVSISEIPSFIVPVSILFFLLATVYLLITGLYMAAVFCFIIFIIPITLYTIRLYMKSGKQLSLFDIIKFYSIYFPARATGTLIGLFKNITRSKLQ